MSCIDKALRVVAGSSRADGCDPVSGSWFLSSGSRWVFLHWEQAVVLGAPLGLPRGWVAAPQAAVPGCWVHLQHWLCLRMAVPELALAVESCWFLKDALVSCRYSWECGHAAPRRGDESR